MYPARGFSIYGTLMAVSFFVIIKFHYDILGIISEFCAKKVKTAAIFRIPLYLQLKFNTIAVYQAESVDIFPADGLIVNITAHPQNDTGN